ncbi:C40 family peptidase [Paenibacillus sp.]|uniref:C40 family peptidase n=1 Tax=Paenibacillus sp. TaxID=58172 RepID=UPI0039C8C136
MKTPMNKLIASIALCLSITLLGSLVLMPETVQAASKSSAIVSTGKKYMGVPYKFGITSRFDCSSFTQYVYKRNGIKLPRTSKQQSKVGRYVARKDLKRGDLVIFYKPFHHVGIYMGDGKVLHTYGKPGVTISNMKSGWWNRNYTTDRRVL